MTDRQPVRLEEAEARRIFRDKIVPRELAQGVPQAEPLAIFVAGQPGAGKTATTRSLLARLEDRGGGVVVDADLYKGYHPRYATLQQEDDQAAAALVSPDSGRWMGMAQEWLAEHRIDTLTETTMRDDGYFARPAGTFRAAGYRVEAAIMAVPEAQSRLGILDRYEMQVRTTGHGRLTLRDNHDSAYRGVVETADAIDRDRLADSVSVYRRGNELLYHNELTPDGTWRDPAGTRAAIEQERSRPWTVAESAQFAATYHRLARDLGPEFHDELAGIARSAAPLLHPDVEVRPPGPPARDVAAALDRAERATGIALAAESERGLPTRPAEREEPEISR